MMHNEEVELSIEDCRQEMQRLKGLIEMVGVMSPISNFLTKYAAVRCCGALEQGYKSIIADYYEQFSDQLVSFISTHVRESSKNPSLANICTILNAFDEDKCSNFKNAVKHLDNATIVRESLDSINKVRNNVAHGIDVSMSFNEIIEHFERSLKVLECLDAVFLNDRNKFYRMTKGQIIAQQHANSAVVKFIEEVITTDHVKEETFDKTRDSALECTKQNIEASSLTEREKNVAKESVDKVVHDIAQIFKDGMTRSGRIIKSQ